MDHKAFVKALTELSKDNAEYAAFNKRIVNTRKELLGVRTPDMRKLAKEIAKDIDYKGVESFLGEIDKNSFEQVMVCGFVIVFAKITEEEKISLTREYLKYADSWAIIDLFTNKMKKFNEILWWDYAVECLASDEEFTVRYGVMRLMESFLDETHLKKVFRALRKVKHEGYYVKMGMAWLYATAAIQDFEGTINELERKGTDRWTRGKSLQKMIESYRISDEQKEIIREKRNNGKKSQMVKNSS